MLRKAGNPGLKGRLLNKSIEAYILSLETINSLSIKYRVETFSYLLCNAWELLLKAKIITDSGDNKSIYYSQKTGEQKRTLALRDCIGKILTNENDPVRLNIEKVADLRDEACHLVISKVPKEVLGLFQSSVLNYHQKLSHWFDVSLADRVSIGMMTIVYEFSPEEFNMSSPRLRKEMGKETADYLLKYQAAIQQESERLGKPAEFSIDIRWRMVITNKVSDGDISLTSGGSEPTTRTVEVPKDPGTTHPYRLKELLIEVNQELDGRWRVASYELQCVNKVFNVAKRPEFYYKGKFSGSPQYSQAFSAWLVKQFENNANFFTHARAKASTPRVEPMAK